MGHDVRHNPDKSRYEIVVDGRVAGEAQYREVEGRLVFTHTEIDPDFEGQGLGSRLAAGALDHVRAAGRLVVARCPFIASYIDRHPEYGDLVDKELAARL